MEEKDKQAFLLRMQRAELDGAVLYAHIARRAKAKEEREKLAAISQAEYRHAAIFARHTKVRVRENRPLVFLLLAVSVVFGYTFIIKLFESMEDKTQRLYREHLDLAPEIGDILKEEEAHEDSLIAMLDEERLRYVGDLVLGMNDALVELTGALAGYTFAMRNTRTIAMAGLIMGVAATLSMMSSSYLSSRASGSADAGKSGVYTGVAYIVTVALLILPYLLPGVGYLTALFIMLVITVAIIAVFNFYISVAKGENFRRSFFTMAGISLGVAAISFVVGVLVKNVMGINL